MGGLLQAYGQSTAGQTFADVTKNMMGVAEAGAKMRQMDLENQYRQAGLDIAKAEEARKAKAAAEQEAQLDRPMDISVHPLFLSLPDEQKPAVLKYFSDSGYTDSAGRGKTRDVLAGVVAIEKSKDLFTEFMSPVVEAKKAEVIQSWGVLQDATESGDEKKIAAAQASFNKAKMAYEASGSKFSEHLNKLDEIAATRAAKAPETKEFIGADGKWYQGTVTGKDAKGNPTYTNVVPYTPKPVAEPTGLDSTWLVNWKKSHPDATPEQENAAITKHQQETGAIRGEAFAKSRPVNVFDTKNNNAPAIMSLADVQTANALEPGRYIPITGSAKALGQTALIEDIRGAISNTRQSLANLKTEFSATQAAQIALVMKQRDPRSATSAFIGSQVGLTLTPDQIDYITDLAQLIENGMAMRSVLGAGQGSDELRSAIMATIPSAKTPSRAYAVKQLQKFEQQINRLSAGVPKVPLRTDIGETQTPSAGGGPTVIRYDAQGNRVP